MMSTVYTSSYEARVVLDQVPGFKACFGGEELNRAVAALTGDVVGGTIKFNFSDEITPSTARLSTLSPNIEKTSPTLSPASSLAQPSAPPLSTAPKPDHLSVTSPVAQSRWGDGNSHGSLTHQDPLLKELIATSKMYSEMIKEQENKRGVGASADHDELSHALHLLDVHYSLGLVLQELASKIPVGNPDHCMYLEQACDAYQAALVAKPTSHAALYNWGVALSDLARVYKSSAPCQVIGGGSSLPAVTLNQSTFSGSTSGKRGSFGTSSGQAAAAVGGNASTTRSEAVTAGSRLNQGTASGVALSRQCLSLASEKYAEAVRLNPQNPQALNNWGLVLQEMSVDAETMSERDKLVHYAMEKFRCALRMRPDFDRGCYNLGTVSYTYACTLQNELTEQYRGISLGSLDDEGQALRQSRESDIRTAFTTAAQYICLAFAMQQQKDVYRRSLSLVRSMLPLPFLRSGVLTVSSPPSSSSSTSSGEVWRRELLVLDHRSLHIASALESSLCNSVSAGMPLPAQRPAPADSSTHPSVKLVIPLSDVCTARRCSDPTLPHGYGIWLGLVSNPAGVYMVAESAECAESWVDAVLLSAHVVQSRGEDALAIALTPAVHSGGRGGM
ncbi:hypothetical protein CEUSTIGMA_g8021.t1 [Chlamydomonas eustigma]|uniref:PH domain-containing protein n=1 Tax=Chlamydomonas eustigma TaxID=1157962 RepID=A0A250XBX8_9CHLO|nr:hypothetical protein CEUSTIGMA_g8021.t1 [Chlamydomonas eustigma]|eukprot:GAX80584.1 hypothetical protein CEUSTIGMA_g8021.t1 [Chlamydomonas eustigma]